MRNNINILKKFSNIAVVKGYNRSIISDFQRNDFYYIPNTMADFLKNYEGKEIKDEIKDEIRDKYCDYIDFLIEKDLIFFCHEKEVKQFQEMSLEWDYPNKISNSIIEYDDNKKHIFFKGLHFLLEIGCEDYLIVSNSSLSSQEINQILAYSTDYLLNSITFYIGNDNSQNTDYLKIIKEHPNVLNIVLFNSSKSSNIIHNETFGNLIQTTKQLDYEDYEKDISLFNMSITHFCEAQQHNTYFNRKIFIGCNGEIKNAPTSSIVFGNIEMLSDFLSIEDILQNPEFKELWFTSKSDTEVCRFCEYRFMCTDSRVPIKMREGKWFFKEECNYNPFISKWRGENGHLSIESCGRLTGEKTFVINTKKVKDINKTLWHT